MDEHGDGVTRNAEIVQVVRRDVRRSLIAAVALALIACSGPTALPAASVSGTPERRASVETTLPPEFRAAVGWARLPAAIEAPKSSGPCGEAATKLVSRIEPPLRAPSGEWHFKGCLYAEGTAFTKVFIELTFPDGTKLLAPIADKTLPDREYFYDVVVQRADVGGVTAVLFAVTP
jgi:hypothetical protein